MTDRLRTDREASYDGAQLTLQGKRAVVRLIESVLWFLGITALAGGVAMVAEFGNGEWGLPREWLEAIPLIDSWLIPGLVLALGFGIGSLVTVWGVRKRPVWEWMDRALGFHWSWLATVIIGLGHLVWIGLELVFLPEATFLQAVYGAVGLLLLVLPLLPGARAYFRTARA